MAKKVEAKEKSFEENSTDIFGLLDSINVDDIKSKGLTIRAGDRLLKFEVISDSSLTVEDEIRGEFRETLHKKIQLIREKVNQKIQEMSIFIQTKKSEYDSKERELKERLRLATPMPNVTWEHARKGLSVVKGDGKDELTWLVQGIYWPKSVDRNPLNGKFSKKMLSNVIYVIKTKGDKVIGASTRQPLGLEYFSHYHQSNPDCWGKWSPIRKWNSPDDIIKVAREAEAVLENINLLSVANQAPRGLPRKDTVMKHVIKKEKDKVLNTTGPLSQDMRRTGMTVELREDDTWST